MKLIITSLFIILTVLPNIIYSKQNNENTTLKNFQKTYTNNIPLSAYVQKQKLIEQNVNGNSVEGDNFGQSVDIDNNFAIIGIPNSYGKGGVDIYQNIENDWILNQSILPSELNLIYEIENFGEKVQVQNNLAIINATIVANGNMLLFIYRYDGTTWLYEDTISSDSIQPQSNYIFLNMDFNLSGNSIAITATNFSTKRGVFIYEFNGTNWVQNSIVYEETINTPFDRVKRSNHITAI